MQGNKAVLVQLPVPFATFAKVKVLVPIAGLGTLAASLTAAQAETLSVNVHTAKLHEVSNTVMAKQPGGSLVAYPCSAGHCQVICHKVRFALTTAWVGPCVPCLCSCVSASATCSKDSLYAAECCRQCLQRAESPAEPFTDQDA